jgi:hypothetical protein
MPKHKHAELIKAWADGAAIEVLCGRVWRSTDEPAWFQEDQYRIKPKPPVVLAGIEVPIPNRMGNFAVGVSWEGDFTVYDMNSWQEKTKALYRKIGLVHELKANAQLHADALNAFHKQLMES